MSEPLSKLHNPQGEARVASADKAYVSGEPVQLDDNKVGVYTGLKPVKSGEPFAVETDGIREFPCATAVTFSANAELHWHIENQTVVTAADGSDTFPLGRAHAAKTSGQLVAIVDITTTQMDAAIDTDIAAIP